MIDHALIRRIAARTHAEDDAHQRQRRIRNGRMTESEPGRPGGSWMDVGPTAEQCMMLGSLPSGTLAKGVIE